MNSHQLHRLNRLPRLGATLPFATLLGLLVLAASAPATGVRASVGHPVPKLSCRGAEIHQETNRVTATFKKGSASAEAKLYFTGVAFSGRATCSRASRNVPHAFWHKTYARTWAKGNSSGISNVKISVKKARFWNRPQSGAGSTWSFAQAYVDIVVSSKQCVDLTIKGQGFKVCPSRTQSFRLYGNVYATGKVTGLLED